MKGEGKKYKSASSTNMVVKRAASAVALCTQVYLCF